MSEGQGSRLAVVIDGTALADDEARALWREFSEHMEANRGDVSGFAAKKGYVSVAPQYQDGRAVLVVWVTRLPPKPESPPPRAKPTAARAPTPARRSPKPPARPRAGASARGSGSGGSGGSGGGAKRESKPAARSRPPKRRG
jgi:hypothetical protein